MSCGGTPLNGISALRKQASENLTLPPSEDAPARNLEGGLGLGPPSMVSDRFLLFRRCPVGGVLLQQPT